MTKPISIRLLNTLKKGVGSLSDEAMLQVKNYVQSQINAKSVFANRGGMPDLYYTAFGWMLCYVLKIKLNPERMRTYLDGIDADGLDLIHYAAYQRCKVLAYLSKYGELLTGISSFKPQKIKAIRDFTAIPHNDPDSPYSQFIWVSLLEDTGHKLTDKKERIAKLNEYRLESGGYRNMPEGLGATTNATVAALAVRGQLGGYKTNQDVVFLKELQQPSGGFCAAGATPVPDLLSTATALFMLECYKGKPKFNPADFLEAHWLPSGGFCPTLVDETSDVEYTFYGLLALGTLV